MHLIPLIIALSVIHITITIAGAPVLPGNILFIRALCFDQSQVQGYLYFLKTRANRRAARLLIRSRVLYRQHTCDEISIGRLHMQLCIIYRCGSYRLMATTDEQEEAIFRNAQQNRC